MTKGSSYERLLAENSEIREENTELLTRLDALAEHLNVIQDALEQLIVEFDDLMLVMGMFGTVDTEDSSVKKEALVAAVSALDEPHFEDLMKKLDLEMASPFVPNPQTETVD